MKFMTTCTAIAVALTAASGASAQGMGDFYASVFGGFSAGETIVDSSYSGVDVEQGLESESGYVLGVTVGSTVAPGLRAEAEVSYANYSIGSVSIAATNGVSSKSASIDAPDDTVVTTTYLLGNLWYDVPGVATGSGVLPYVGGGLGLAIVNGDVDGEDIFDQTIGIAYQAGVGVQIPVGAGLIDVGYRFKGFTGADIDFDDDSGLGGDGSGYNNNFQVGYAIKF